ncbi:hypothetical protein [Brevibacillus laterosporus]|uniref:hypothetical protein n=1 Tax=Brevibacillus laterosporus TaxID=1465 RepID=UPI0018F8B389|nr:hypothetical protein [Brevibacillus laterosporus]MBG9776124.1 hypothetical protein [Brevibacillus laterosporus]
MITKKKLIKRHKIKVKEAQKPQSSFGSIPKPMFIGEKWNPFNWNGGDGVIRQWTGWLRYDSGSTQSKEFDYLDYGYLMIANLNWYEDQTYITITLHKYWHDAITDEEDKRTFDQYLITYYKNRGKTDEILLNGRQVNLDEYVHLLNIIEASGYKFDLSI